MGFTSLPQTVLVRSLASSKDAKEKNKMKTDWDGSSDKYARMIAKWLEKLGLVKQEAKPVTVTLAGRKYTESIGRPMCYRIRDNRPEPNSRQKPGISGFLKMYPLK